jgi:hypothetical protein
VRAVVQLGQVADQPQLRGRPDDHDVELAVGHRRGRGDVHPRAVVAGVGDDDGVGLLDELLAVDVDGEPGRVVAEQRTDGGVGVLQRVREPVQRLDEL